MHANDIDSQCVLTIIFTNSYEKYAKITYYRFMMNVKDIIKVL